MELKCKVRKQATISQCKLMEPRTGNRSSVATKTVPLYLFSAFSLILSS